MATKDLAQWAIQLNYQDLHPKVVTMAKYCILDTIGSALAGADTPVAKIVREFALEGACQGKASVWASHNQTRADLAALVNGTMAHALDFDETNYSSIAHPSSVVLPAVLSQAQYDTCSGQELLTAFVIGYEITGKLGAAVNPETYLKGWWTTSLLGTIGAAAAVARLSRFDTDQMTMALNLAASQAAGVISNFGTMAKPFFAGKAAQNGLTAARMASMGLTAATNLLDSEGAFFALITDGGVKDALTKIGTPYELIEPGVAFKRFPSCSATHAAVDAVIKLATAYDLKPEDLLRIRCEITPQVDYCLIYDEPNSLDEARFSLPVCVAQAFKYRDLPPVCFSTEELKDPVLQKLMKRIVKTVHRDFEPGGKNFYPDAPEASRIVIETKDGRVLSETVLHAKGSKQNPLTEKELIEKYRRLASPVLPENNIAEIEELVFTLETQEQAERLAQVMEERIDER